jgi:hypothetical protein
VKEETTLARQRALPSDVQLPASRDVQLNSSTVLQSRPKPEQPDRLHETIGRPFRIAKRRAAALYASGRYHIVSPADLKAAADKISATAVSGAFDEKGVTATAVTP